MIEVAARELVDRLRQVEERLERLLTSGWRQSGSEAADLRDDADALAEAGLPALAGRIAAVAEAADAAQALTAIALAVSACRLLRLRVLADAVPDGWLPLMRSRPSRSSRTEALVPISRLLVDGHEVWVCTQPNRNVMLLIEPPFPLEQPAQPAAAPTEAGGVFERLRRQIRQALGGETRAPAPWLQRRLAGSLRWQAQYPVGVQGDVGYWTLEDPSWATGQEEHSNACAIQQMGRTGTLQDGASLFWTSGGFRVRELERDEPASYVWLDPSAAAAFGAAPSKTLWAITWMEGAAVVPVALLAPAGKVSPPRLTHLMPGLPDDVLFT